jgi:hypothetical protein
VAVGISVTCSLLDSVTELIHELRQACPAVPVVLGGEGIEGTSQAIAMGADGFAADAREFVTMLDAMQAPSTISAASITST